MDSGNSGAEFDIGKIIADVKNDENGPEARARKVYTHLLAHKELTTWDLVCFCAEYIGSMVGALPWIEEPARALIRLVYLAHHVRFEGVEWLDKKISDKESPSTKE